MSEVPVAAILGHWSERRDPDAPAIIHERAQISWRELDARTNRLARAYRRLGVRPNDLVTIALPNGIEFFCAAFATWKLGATPQPVSAKAPQLERDQIIGLANSALVVGVPS